ncbi:MAG: rRNA maturation RNase YbeY [Halanaerobiales bacterium]
MIEVKINNQQDLVEVNTNLKEMFGIIAEKTAEIEGYSDGEISFALVDNKKIQELNRKYRDKDSPTDVLSFEMDDEIWGDIIISTERASSQAEKYGHSLEREIGYLAIHGLLHLLGYDHKSAGEKHEMRQKEERVLGELNLNRD